MRPTRSKLLHRPCLQRGIRLSFPARSDVVQQTPSGDGVEQEQVTAQEGELADALERELNSVSPEEQSSAPSDTSFRKFMETIAPEFQTASPRNWLGETPFPLNSSFKPPPPISDAQRDEMYALYMTDPEKNNIRALSTRFHVSINRVDAILRLKGMQREWAKGNAIQTGFVRGMERLLAVPKYSKKTSLGDEDDWALEELRTDVHEADLLEESEHNDPARIRYQRMYWESLPEFGGDAIVPASLERSRTRAKELASKAGQLKDRQYLPVIPDTYTIKTPKEPIHISSKEGRPDIHFIDVGTKFLDIASETKRLTRINSRARARTKNLAGKQKLTTTILHLR
ncbi:hypothetical protein D9757_002299 [Collybiopsis confluens]|uniref:Uncharacterized protein n=1 Tax=Collybiopsis confluens TaxID=2823264 RepID=A0A8H5HZI9_9AGAR|nr:hypothetical protein D9757_002299 [Collybiopsis confluens]